MLYSVCHKQKIKAEPPTAIGDNNDDSIYHGNSIDGTPHTLQKQKLSPSSLWG